MSSNTNTSSDFVLNVALPTDPRFAQTARELAVYAAKHAGCTETKADAVGDEVEQILRRCLEAGGTADYVPLVVRRSSGPIEVLIDGRTLTLEP